jgi:flavin reductase (DIM6/NTAB) family NADH-FMN oxidoreductase RutF
MPISSDVYRQVGRAAAGAVSIVATYDHARSEIVALTVSSFVTLSFEPPLVMFAIQHNTDSYASVVTSKSFGVSLLSAEQAEIARLFASQGREQARRTSFSLGQVLQVPLIPGALAQIECRTSEIFMSGDHAIVVGQVEGASTRTGEPLLYFARQYGSFRPLPGG